MEIQKTYKYRLRLSKQQESLLLNWIGACRVVYNLALETKQHAYKAYGVNYSSFDLMKQVTELRDDIEWIKNVPAQTLQDVIERMDSAYQSFFRGNGFPRWAKKGKYISITFKSISKVSDTVFKLPKIGTVSIFKDRPIKGELRRATISIKNNKFYISILTKQERETTIVHDNQVGIDMGVAFFASLSNGVQIENPRFTRTNERILRFRQRSLSRKIKWSNRWCKQKLLVGKLQEKIANQRKDFLHKHSSQIANSHSFIAVEDLKVKNMIKFGNLSNPISDASWAEFFSQLEYKTGWRGTTFVRVDPKYTSQTCSDCGSVNKLSRISQSEFVCVECGHIANADVNASKEILRRGTVLCRQREALWPVRRQKNPLP